MEMEAGERIDMSIPRATRRSRRHDQSVHTDLRPSGETARLIQARDWVKANPEEAVAVSFGIGMMIGLWMRS